MDEFLRSVLEALVKSADRFCQIFSDNQKRYEDMSCENQKHYENLSQETHNRSVEISHENRTHYESMMRANQKHADDLLEKEQQYNAELHTKQRRDHTIVTILTIIFGAITFFGAMLWHIESSRTDARLQIERKQMDMRMQQQANKIDFVKIELQQRYHKESILQDNVRELREKMKTYFELRDELMMAMANMREVIAFGQEQCVNGKYAGKDQLGYKEKSLRTIYNLVGVSYKIAHIFSADIDKETMRFISVAANTKVCISNTTTPHELRTLQENINTMIVTSVDNLAKEKEITENELQNEEKAINKILSGDINKKT